MPRVESHRAEIHYVVHDPSVDGLETLVCIMGLGAASNWWFRQVEGLCDRYRIVTFDNRGVGESDRPQGPYTMAQMVDDTLAVMDATETPRAHVMGISMGGMIAQNLVLTRPERVARLVLACTHAGGPNIEPPDAKVVNALTGRVGNLGVAVEEMLDQVGWTLFPEDFLRANGRELAAAMSAHAPRPPEPHGFIGQVMAIMGHNTRERLHEIEHETLVITGDVDVLVPPGNSKVLAEGLPKARLEVMEGCGHGLNMQSPADFNRRVDAFLAGRA